jgi:hypothetical protein
LDELLAEIGVRGLGRDGGDGVRIVPYCDARTMKDASIRIRSA